MTAGTVLIHGGGFDARCWDLLLPHLGDAAIAVDLPGRGAHPAPPHEVTFAACAAAVEADVDAAGFDEAVLVGHSLAGCSLPAIVDRLGPDRVAHVLLLGATVPPDGRACVDTLDPAVQELVRSRPDDEPQVMGGDIARLVLGDDLTDEQLAWCVERLVPEAPRLTLDPVATGPLQAATTTWIRTTRDQIVVPAKQAAFAAALDPCPVVDLDAGHMCMVSRPLELAEKISEILRR